MKRSIITGILVVGVVAGGLLIFLAHRAPHPTEPEQFASQPIPKPAGTGETHHVTAPAPSRGPEPIAETKTITTAQTGKPEPALPTDISTLKATAEAAMSRKAFDKARPLLEKAYALVTDADEKMTLGQQLYECLIRTHAYDEALALGRELLTLSPSPEERLLMTQQLAALLHRMGKANEAEALLTQAMAAEQDPATRAKCKEKCES